MATGTHLTAACGPTPAHHHDTGKAGQYLVFTLGGEAFAIDILRIREIIEYGEPTVVPMMPEAIRGVINLRGAVVPVVDLSARFGRGRTEAGRRTCIVILEVDTEAAEAGSQTLGIVVDGVNEVLEIPADHIEPPPGFGARLRTDFIAGMGRREGGFIIILDLLRVLCPDEMARLADGIGELAVPA